MAHEIVIDRPCGHLRVTCMTCPERRNTLVRQPFMDDERWALELGTFSASHPSPVLEQLARGSEVQPIPYPYRSCIGCKNWTFDSGHRRWSDVTPGDDWSAHCTKWIPDANGTVRVRWYMAGYSVQDGEWFETMKQAQTCPDYDPRPGAPA